MVCKRILNLVIGLLMLVSIANAANFFDSFEINFEYEKPSTMKVLSFQCQDSGCTTATPISANYYKGDSVVCWTQYGLKGDEAGYLNCMKDYKFQGDTVNLNDPATITDGDAGKVAIFAKYDTNAPFGYVTYFYTEGDTYMTHLFRHEAFICAYDTCVEPSPTQLNFIRGENALAEIGQLNIKNTQNPLFPIQVEVPVKIEETVCSAYRFSQPDVFRPLPPRGYSDYSANTKVTLDITNNANEHIYSQQEITIPILADTCAGLAAFSWTPSEDLLDTEVKFRAETEVIDNQVTSSKIDWAEAIETIYPQNLDGSCWARAYDFTLSNIPNAELTTSVAQITKGESLYALFRAGAFRDESITAMQFDAELYLDGEKLIEQRFMSQDDVSLIAINLSKTILDLQEGEYEVRLVIVPVGTGCEVVEHVEQIQNLEILPVSEYNVTFYVRSDESESIEGADVKLTLLDADDYFQSEYSYNEYLKTNSQGIARFDDVIAGDYRYTVSYPDYDSVTNNIHIGGPTDIYVTLVQENIAPVINLPENFTEFYENPIKFDIIDYIDDYNDDVEDLDITYKVTSGTMDIDFEGRYFTIRDDEPSVNTLEITVEDPSGERVKDTTQIIFIDNKAPEVLQFEAIPDNGTVPFEPRFEIEVIDSENDYLECVLEFGDGTSTANECDALNDIRHEYTEAGTYIAKLTIEDGYNEPVVVEEKIFAYIEINKEPIILRFEAVPDSGHVPLDTTFRITVTDVNYDDLLCTLDFGDGTSSITDACDDLDKTMHKYTDVGEYTATLSATDGEETVSATEHISVLKPKNNEPIIVEFRAEPDNGRAPLHTTFVIEVKDIENDDLTCTLEFGDGTSSLSGDCDELNLKSHTYKNVGEYTATLRVRDAENTVKATELITVTDCENPTPIIEYFTLESSNDEFIPTDLTLEWRTSHNLGYRTRCVLSVNDAPDELVPCNGGREIENYNIEGQATFTLTINDNESNIVSETIRKTFYKEEDKNLSNVDLELNIDNVINPGNFKFEIISGNESLGRRYVRVEPQIICRGTVNEITSVSDLLRTSAVSQNSIDGFVHEFRLNTQDFELTIPKDENCIFRTILTDKYGSEVILEENVTFSYAQREATFASIRGESTDILNYMSSTLIGSGINRGYNTITFNVQNNKAEPKDLSITMISANLGIEFSTQLELAPEQSSQVTMPLFISSSARPGMYPVRYTVRDAEETQTRYSYILIK